MSRDIIVCENMGKIFETSRGQVPVIEDVTLQVRENEFLVLFGPGQCGKSTMINCMSGLEPVTEGKVEVNGKIVSGPSPDRGGSLSAYGIVPLAYGYGKCGIRSQSTGSSQTGAAGKSPALY